jgi:cell division protein FtsB
MQSEFITKWFDHLAAIIARLIPLRRRIATGAVITLAVLLGYHVMFGANGMVVYHKKRSEYRKLQTEIQQVQAENEKLDQQIRALKSDPKAIEKEAREQLKYTRPGEVVYVIPAPHNQKRDVISAEKR